MMRSRVCDRSPVPSAAPVGTTPSIPVSWRPACETPVGRRISVSCLGEEGLKLLHRIAPKPWVNVHALYRTVVLGREAKQSCAVFDGERMVLLCGRDERRA